MNIKSEITSRLSNINEICLFISFIKYLIWHHNNYGERRFLHDKYGFCLVLSCMNNEYIENIFDTYNITTHVWNKNTKSKKKLCRFASITSCCICNIANWIKKVEHQTFLLNDTLDFNLFLNLLIISILVFDVVFIFYFKVFSNFLHVSNEFGKQHMI